MEEFTRCFGCMNPLPEPGAVCPKCKFNIAKYKANPRCLQPGMTLNDKYVVGKVLGEGGFGITYIAWDKILDMTVAVKEYFPSNIASRDTTNGKSETINVFAGKGETSFKCGLERYYAEAKTLSKFHAERGIVTIREFFYSNETAYIIMDYVDGVSLKKYLRMAGKMRPSDVFEIMKPIMSSLARVHAAGMIHRDISPDNIMIAKTGQMVLIDFGATRTTNDEDNKSLTIMLKRGFAPPEQYHSKGQQGTWTDVYTISATIYNMITGEVPPEAMDRVLDDELKPISEFGIEIPGYQEKAIMKGMAVRHTDRYETIQELYKAIYNSEVEKKQKEGALSKALSTVEQSIAEDVQGQGVVSEVEETVLAEEVPEIEETILVDDAPDADEMVSSDEAQKENRPPSSVHGRKRKKIKTAAVLLLLLAGGIAAGLILFVRQDGRDQEVAQTNFKSPSAVTNASVSPEATPAVTPEITPEVTPAATPEITPEITPAATPEASPAVETKQITTIQVTGQTAAKAEKKITIPSLAGTGKKSAAKKLKAAGLRCEIAGYDYSSSYDAGTVIRQKPKSGKKKKRNSTVQIWISRGKKPEESSGRRTETTSNYSSQRSSSNRTTSNKSSSGSKTRSSSKKSSPMGDYSDKSPIG